MTEDNTQPVAPDDTASKTAVEEQGARTEDKSLTDFLAEFETATVSSPKPAPAPAVPDPVSELKSQVDYLVNRDRKLQEKADLDNAVKELRGDLDVQDYVVKGWIGHLAEQNPEINKIWDNRLENPAAAKRMLSRLKGEFQKEQASKVDPSATADREAVTFAVKGASPKAPQEKPPDYSSMSGPEFEAEKRKLGL